MPLMADADEDAIPRSDSSSSNIHNLDYDPEDEAQDFRFLASLSGANGALPKRGEKDFEPNPTKAQQNVLNASREAMHNALAVERVHMPKTVCIGAYLPNPAEWWCDSGSEGLAPGSRCVVVEKFRGGHNKTVGREDYRHWTWLLPEEALYLIERGSLDIRWPDEGRIDLIEKILVEDDEDTHQDSPLIKHNDEDEPEEIKEDAPGKQNGNPVAATADSPKFLHILHIGETPMSLQGAYACLIGKSGLSLERYSVYVGLKRLGYILQRAPTWDEQLESKPEGFVGDLHSKNTDITSPCVKNNARTGGNHEKNAPNPLLLMSKLLSWLLKSDEPQQFNTATGPLIRPGIYRNYSDIFRTLGLIPSIDPPMVPPSLSKNRGQLDTETKPDRPLKIHYRINKPTPAYRKTAPPPPDFQVSIINARTSPSIPTLDQLSDLLDSMNPSYLPDITNSNGQKIPRKIEAKLKHGRRNVILAIVDCGVVSYLRMADMGFSELGKVYEEKARRGTKGRGGGGARRGGGHRGRGRGRGGR